MRPCSECGVPNTRPGLTSICEDCEELEREIERARRPRLRDILAATDERDEESAPW